MLVTFSVRGQRGEVKGIVRDTTAFPRVDKATAAVIGASDSVLKAFTHTRKDGFFIISNLPFGNYILIISHPNFGDYVEEISLSDSTQNISKDFYLTSKTILINEVIIQRQRDIKINGDTTEFNDTNYKLLENANADIIIVLDGDAKDYAKTIKNQLNKDRLKNKVKICIINDDNMDPSKIYELYGSKGVIELLRNGIEDID